MEPHEFEETIIMLEKIRGRHTELITVYVPAGFSLNSVAKQLEAEKNPYLVNDGLHHQASQ